MPRRTSTGPPDDLEARIDRLFAAPLDRFVADRNALAAELRREGHADEAARVKGITRPPLPAWALNQVYWHARDEFDILTSAGDRLRDLQRQALGGRDVDLHEATKERQQAVRAVVDRAVALMKGAGQAVTDSTRQRISVMADAIAAYGSRTQVYTPGRLEEEIGPPGFEALAGLAAGAPPLRLVKPAREPQSPRAKPVADAGTAARTGTRSAEEREEQRRRERALKEAAAERRTRERDLERAKQHESALSARLAELRRELAPLEMRLAALQQRAQDAEAALEKARAQVREATAALARVADRDAE